MRRTPPLLLFACALGLPAGAVAQHPTQGPLTAEEGAPLQRLGFTPTVEGAAVTPRGAVRVDLWLAYGNVWEQDSSAVANVFLDLERLIVAPTVRVGVLEGLELGVRATLERTGGGFLDGLVTGLHDVVGAGDRNRPDYPANRYGQWLRDARGKLLVEIPGRSRPALEDVRLFAKWRAYASADDRRAVSVTGAVRVPTADNLLGEERADAALTVAGHAGWRGWYLHGLVGGTTVRRSPELRDVLRDRQWLFMAGAERPLSPTLSLLIQATGSTQLLQDLGEHDVDGALTNVVFGVAWRQGPWRWEVALQEDAPARGPSTDFTVQVGVSRAW
ncbi:MAG: hypothetical protein AMXMBFR53_17660 [Gemmatimonadota bacterium]